MRPFRALLALTLLAAGGATVLATSGSTAVAATSRPVTTHTVTHHAVVNLGGSTRPARLGFDIFDVGASRAAVNALPAGVKGLVWLGQGCPTPADAAFRRTVRALSHNPKVFAYYLSDEPHLRTCPGAARGLASRADVIRSVTHGRQKSFVVISQSSADWNAGYRDTRALRPAVTHLDLIGIDSYPCSVAGCDDSKIGEKVRFARRGGIPLAAIVPVYQAFGQENAPDEHYYRLPTPGQERAMLRTWRRLVPHPVFDLAYGWRHQGTANPTLADEPALQQVFAQFFAATGRA